MLAIYFDFYLNCKKRFVTKFTFFAPLELHFAIKKHVKISIPTRKISNFMIFACPIFALQCSTTLK